MSWMETTIGEFVEIKHGFAFKGEFFNDDGEYVVLTPGNCHNDGGFKAKGEKEKRYSGDIPQGYLLSKGDLLVVLTDLVGTAPVLGGSFVIPEDNIYLHNQRLGLVTLKDGVEADLGFFYHLFNTHDYRGQVRGSASGATVRHTSPGRILSCKVKVPDLAVQKRIASILSTYDDLIENNRRRIALLEAAARLLYREWFVHFRFPGHEHVNIVDGVPEGWVHTPMVELVEMVMGQSPKSEFYNSHGEGLPFHQGVTNYGFRFVTDVTYSTNITKLAEANDILFSVRAPVGRINITLNRMVLGRGLAAFRSKSGNQSFLFYQLKNHFFKEDLIGGGAIYAATNKKELEKLELLQPTDDLIQSFEQFSKPIDEQIRALTMKTDQLIKARDILLPRLMDGRLEV